MSKAVPSTPPSKGRKRPLPASPKPRRGQRAQLSDDDEDAKPNLAYLPSPSASPLRGKDAGSSRADKKPKLEDAKPQVVDDAAEDKPKRPQRKAALAVVFDEPNDSGDNDEGGDEGGAYEGEGEGEGVLIAGLERRRIAPSQVQGMEVHWDRQVKTIITTKAKSLYKLTDDYLYSLDRDSTRNSQGYPMYLYSEHQVQKAAYDMQGGEAYFNARIQGLHATRMLKAANKGLTMNPLDPNKPPLAPVPYAKKSTRASWVDSTTRARAVDFDF
ncbi:hypothetical protein RQP46_004534 [Phenoliferia psychrophenolica]